MIELIENVGEVKILMHVNTTYDEMRHTLLTTFHTGSPGSVVDRRFAKTASMTAL
ncbi:hypothetical protein KBI52_02915 [Microvirga sp. HBU67558]|nr:hypothetical protein [Microvirga sp. HBU67558]